MAQNVTIAGAQYSGVPAVDLPKTGGGTAKFVDTSDATAAAADIARGKTAYVNGTRVNGTAEGANIQTSKSITITSNGSTTITPDSGYDAIKNVSVDVNVSGAGGGTVTNAALICYYSSDNTTHALSSNNPLTLNSSHDYIVLRSITSSTGVCAYISANEFVTNTLNVIMGKLAINNGVLTYKEGLTANLNFAVVEITKR